MATPHGLAEMLSKANCLAPTSHLANLKAISGRRRHMGFWCVNRNAGHVVPTRASESRIFPFKSVA